MSLTPQTISSRQWDSVHKPVEANYGETPVSLETTATNVSGQRPRARHTDSDRYASLETDPIQATIYASPHPSSIQCIDFAQLGQLVTTPNERYIDSVLDQPPLATEWSPMLHPEVLPLDKELDFIGPSLLREVCTRILLYPSVNAMMGCASRHAKLGRISYA